MIAMIETLISKGHAYVADGHVLFAVPSMENYGALSRLSQDELIAGARVDVAPYKKDPADFVLWKPSTPEQVGWDSPWVNQWGKRGRPGWHIECSAMAEKLLSETFDIHCGGLDLRFPHHENEIAQSCCAHDGKPLAKFWLHNGFLSINGEKMSKSLGNFFTVRDLLAKYPGEVIRLVLLSTHYRQPLDFTDEIMEAAKAQLDSWYRKLGSTSGHIETGIPPAIEAALDDDLNTPLAITVMRDIVAKKLSSSIGYDDESNKSQVIGMPDSKDRITPLPSINYGYARGRSELLAAGHALGLLRQDPEAWFKWQPEGQQGLSDTAIDVLIAARLTARQSKNFAEADRIRKELADNKIILEDAAGVTTWRRG
jgi:cysteinyl-tRNA synthetase